MKKHTLFIWLGGNLLIALYGILMSFQGFNRVFGVILYFGKHDNHFPDGIESWIMPALLECRGTLFRLFGAFLVLLLFNSLLGVWIWLTKKKDDPVF